MKWGSLSCTHPKFHFVLLNKSWFYLLGRAVSHLISVRSMLMKSFLFLFKGNQERDNEQLGKIEGICYLKKYSLISEMKMLCNYE